MLSGFLLISSLRSTFSCLKPSSYFGLCLVVDRWLQTIPGSRLSLPLRGRRCGYLPPQKPPSSPISSAKIRSCPHFWKSESRGCTYTESLRLWWSQLPPKPWTARKESSSKVRGMGGSSHSVQLNGDQAVCKLFGINNTSQQVCEISLFLINERLNSL